MIENCTTHPYWIKNGYVKYQNRRHGGHAEYSVNNEKKIFFDNANGLNKIFFFYIYISVEMVIN